MMDKKRRIKNKSFQMILNVFFNSLMVILQTKKQSDKTCGVQLGQSKGSKEHKNHVHKIISIFKHNHKYVLMGQ